MNLNLFWFLPTHGDGHYLGSDAGAARLITAICNRLRRPLTDSDLPAC